MALQSVWTLTTSQSRQTTHQTIFTVIFLAIVIGWIIIALWTRVLDNFTYGVLKLEDSSTWDTLLIALVITIIFISLIWVVDEYEITTSPLEEEIESEESPVDDLKSISLQNSRNITQGSIGVLFPGVVFR